MDTYLAYTAGFTAGVGIPDSTIIAARHTAIQTIPFCTVGASDAGVNAGHYLQGSPHAANTPGGAAAAPTVTRAHTIAIASVAIGNASPAHVANPASVSVAFPRGYVDHPSAAVVGGHRYEQLSVLFNRVQCCSRHTWRLHSHGTSNNSNERVASSSGTWARGGLVWR